MSRSHAPQAAYSSSSFASSTSLARDLVASFRHRTLSGGGDSGKEKERVLMWLLLFFQLLLLLLSMMTIMTVMTTIMMMPTEKKRWPLDGQPASQPARMSYLHAWNNWRQDLLLCSFSWRCFPMEAKVIFSHSFSPFLFFLKIRRLNKNKLPSAQYQEDTALFSHS